MGVKKTTLEIPGDVLRRAKVRAAELKIPLREFISGAVAEKLDEKPGTRDKEKLRLIGAFRRLGQDIDRVNRRVEVEFETIEPEEHD